MQKLKSIGIHYRDNENKRSDRNSDKESERNGKRNSKESKEKGISKGRDAHDKMRAEISRAILTAKERDSWIQNCFNYYVKKIYLYVNKDDNCS